MIKSTTEAIKYISQNEGFAKKVLSHYVRLTDPELLDQSYRFTTENFAKEPFVSLGAIRSIVRQMVQSNMADSKAASSLPLTAYYDNSFVEELKQSGFFEELWK